MESYPENKDINENNQPQESEEQQQPEPIERQDKEGRDINNENTDLNPNNNQQQASQTIPPHIPLELFLTNLKLNRQFFSFYKSRGITTWEDALPFRDFPSKQTETEKKRTEFLWWNIRAIRDELPSDPNQQIWYLIQNEIKFENGIKCSTDMLVKSFKPGNSIPNYCLPTKFQSQNIKPSSIFTSNVDSKKITFLSITTSFTNLKHWYLNNNYVQKIQNMPFPNWEMLEISNNYIKKIENLDQMPSLVKINLSKNLIYVLENLHYNNNLQEIDWSEQFIPKFINFAIHPQCTSSQNRLQIINWESNNLENPTGWGQFPYLKKINLKDNIIMEMMSVLSVCKGCPYMESVNVWQNPFTVENKTTYKNFIIIACKQIKEIDNKEVKENEKVYVNNLFMRKFNNPNPKKGGNAKNEGNKKNWEAWTVTHVTNNNPKYPNPNYH